MAKLKNFLVLFLIMLMGCAKEPAQEKFVKTGTEGIVANFVAGQPPEKIYAEPNSPNFDVVLELRNKGGYPEPGKGSGVNGLGPRFGKIILSGYDSRIINIEDNVRQDLSTFALEGKSAINPNGGQDIIAFTGNINYNQLNVNIYEPILQATSCYYYETETGPSICIDPQPFSTDDKVCQVQDLSLSSQGAPIAITRIDQETFATKTQFRITIQNVGGGEVTDSLEQPDQNQANGQNQEICSSQTLGRDQIDKVRMEFARVSTVPLYCGPFVDTSAKGASGVVRLINDEGSIICEFPSDLYSNKLTAYTTPLSIKLSYTYRTHTQRKLLIVKE